MKDVIYVDEDDNEIGSGSAYDAMLNGIAVRIVRIFVTNSKGEVLIQKRSATVSVPNKWDQSAAGHVDVGDSYDEAAVRELEEEMGIKNVQLTKLTKFYREENTESEKTRKRFNVIYTGVYDGEVMIDNDEVSDYKWVDPNELAKEMIKNSNNYTEGFIEAFRIYGDNL